MSDLGQIQRVLAEIGEGIACRHYYEPRTGVHFDLLAKLGLVIPIKTRVPACDAHGCPLLGQCEHELDFAPGATSRQPKGNRKFRRAPQGAAVADDVALLEQLLAAHPLAELVADALQEGRVSVFSLAQLLLERELAALDIGNAGEEVFRRREVGAYLRLLESLGWVRFEDEGLTLRALRPLAELVSPR